MSAPTMLVRYPDGSAELVELDIVRGSEGKPAANRKLKRPTAAPSHVKPDAVLFGEVADAHRKRSARWEVERWVSLDEAAKRLDLHPDDLASGLIGRVEMRPVDDGLEVDRSELDAALPDLLKSGLLRSKPTPDGVEPTNPTYRTAKAKRKPRQAVPKLRGVPSLRPWATEG